MAAAIYGLCMFTSLACAWLLLASYGRTRHRLLFWSGLCFCGMTLNNLFLILDKLVFPSMNLLTLRLVTALLSVALLLYGLVYEKE